MSLNVRKHIIIFSFVILAFFSVLIKNSRAQVTNDVYVEVVPDKPSPGEQVNLSLTSYSINLDTSQIDWFIGGKKVLSGIGKKKYSLSAPQAGQETIVNINVTSEAGTATLSIQIKPNITVVLWQAEDSFIPPFYKGKALPSADTAIKVVAMPEIKTLAGYINPKNMAYSWRKDYTNDQEASGYGKNSFIYNSDYLDSYNFIEVNATTTDQKFSSSGAVEINTYEPKIVFYKKDDKVGTIFENALKNNEKITDKLLILAAPYFISPKDIRIPGLIWDWSLNNTPVQTNTVQKNLLPLQTQGGISGNSSVKLEISSINNILQTTIGKINISF